jgi:hypothetical protein
MTAPIDAAPLPRLAKHTCFPAQEPELAGSPGRQFMTSRPRHAASRHRLTGGPFAVNAANVAALAAAPTAAALKSRALAWKPTASVK